MALKAGYKGIKGPIADQLNALASLGELATDAEIAEATDKVRADIAPVLAEAKAPTGGISAGDQFYLNDILYTASADIAAGDDIVTTGVGKNADVSSNITEQVYDGLEQKADISALGTEEGATASKLYHPGDHFYKDGKFCTVIGSADVAAESTWTLNTNYVEGTIADAIKNKQNYIYISGNGTNFNVPYVRKDSTINTSALLLFSGGLYHIYLKPSAQSNEVVVHKIYDLNESRDASAIYSNGVLAITFTVNIAGGITILPTNYI